MQRQAPSIQALRQKQQALTTHLPAGQSLLGFINNSSQTHHLVLQRVQPGPNNSVQLWLEDVSFNELGAWLAELYLQGIYVYGFKANATPAPGTVDAEVSLKTRAG